jgi:CheY-like chemotaxis protein
MSPEASAATDVFRVLVVEDTDRMLAEIQGHLRRFAHVEVLPVSRARDAEVLLDGTYVDAAILDIQLHGKDAGLEVLRVMTERAPKATAVIATRYRDRVAPFVGVTTPRIVKIVHKGARENTDEWAADALKNAYQKWSDSRVAIGNLDLAVDLLRGRADRIPGLRADDREVAFEIDRLLRRLFGWVSIDGLGAAAVVSVELSRVEREGLSAAITLRVAVSLGNDDAGRPLPSGPVILKIGPVADIGVETDRYHRFVKYGVPLSARVELLGSAKDQSLGAVCYSLAADRPGATPETLDEALGRENWQQNATVALYQLFDAPAKSWYAVTGAPVTAVNYAYKSLKVDFDGCATALDDTVRSIRRRLRDDDKLVAEPPGELTDGKLSLGAAKLRLPARQFYTTDPFTTSLPTRLVHGDMHGGNVMIETIDRDKVRPRLIDYGSVGPGPRLTDFATLEASTRLVDARRIAAGIAVGENGEARDPAAFRAALLTCANREREERRVLRCWAGEQLRTPPKEQWSIISQGLAARAAINFQGPDAFAPTEYYVMAILVAYRHLGLAVDTLVRVRMAAWISALYEQIMPPE